MQAHQAKLLLSAYFQWANARTRFILPPVVISSLGFIHFTYCVPLALLKRAKATQRTRYDSHLQRGVEGRDERSDWKRSTHHVQTLSAACVEYERIEIK